MTVYGTQIEHLPDIVSSGSRALPESLALSFLFCLTNTLCKKTEAW